MEMLKEYDKGWRVSMGVQLFVAVGVVGLFAVYGGLPQAYIFAVPAAIFAVGFPVQLGLLRRRLARE